MIKKGQFISTVIIAVLFLAVIVGLFWFEHKIKSRYEESDDNTRTEPSCTDDRECVPATCCHARSCVHVDQVPDCTDVFCTRECAPNTLDCNQGMCKCSENKCEALFYE